MIQLVYTSVAATTLGSGDIFKIIEKSVQNNTPAQLTGFLIFANGRFCQVIEGPFSGIDEIMSKLHKDPRHHSIEIVHRATISARSFPNWRMKRILAPEDSGRLETLIPELVQADEAIKCAVDEFLNLAVA